MAQTFMIHFNARKPSPSTYIRTLLQSTLIQNWLIVGKVSLKDFVVEDLRELCNPIEALLDPKNEHAESPTSDGFQIAKRMSWFVGRASNVILPINLRI